MHIHLQKLMKTIASEGKEGHFARIRDLVEKGLSRKMRRMHPPIENSYWVDPGRLLAGEYPGGRDEASTRRKINALILSGITVFIDLTDKNDNLPPYSYLLETATHRRFPIRDSSIPDSIDETAAILDTIDRHLGQGDKVFLHCWGGIGRTGLIVGCWLSRHGFPGNAALSRLRELWKHCSKSSYRQSPETEEQERYIVEWKETR